MNNSIVGQLVRLKSKDQKNFLENLLERVFDKTFGCSYFYDFSKGFFCKTGVSELNIQSIDKSMFVILESVVRDCTVDGHTNSIWKNIRMIRLLGPHIQDNVWYKLDDFDIVQIVPGG